MRSRASIFLLCAGLLTPLSGQELSLVPRNLENGSLEFTFESKPDCTYFLQTSNLRDPQWNFEPWIISGDGSLLEVAADDTGDQEAFFGRLVEIDRSPTSADTDDYDQDGFSNLFELRVLKTSPLAVDSNFDGVADGADDTDDDGLPDDWDLYAASLDPTDEFGSITDISRANLNRVSDALNLAGPQLADLPIVEPPRLLSATRSARRRADDEVEFSNDWADSREGNSTLLRRGGSWTFDSILTEIQNLSPFPKTPPLSPFGRPPRLAVSSFYTINT